MYMMKKLQDIELTIKDENKDGVFAISLVQNPAIEENWVYLSSQEIELKVIDEEQRIVVGYALIPDKKIFRKVQDKEFNIFFSSDTIKKTAELYMKQLNLNNVTTEHNAKIDGASVIESWITQDEKYDKVNLYGIKPIIGGWAVMMKIYNDAEWNEVKKGNYKGFSIEGKFDGFEQLEQNKQIYMKNELLEEVKNIIEVGLKSEVVELGLVDDIEKNVLANGSSRDKARPLIRDSFKSIASALEHYENIKKREQDIVKQSTKFKALVKELGVDVTDQFQKNIMADLYVDKGLDVSIKALKDAISALRNSGEI